MEVATLILASGVSQAQLAQPLWLCRERREWLGLGMGTDLGRARRRAVQPRWVASDRATRQQPFLRDREVSPWGVKGRVPRRGPVQPCGVDFGLHRLYMGLGEISITKGQKSGTINVSVRGGLISHNFKSCWNCWKPQ